MTKNKPDELVFDHALVGVDMSSQPEKTAVCVFAFTGQTLSVHTFLGIEDPQIDFLLNHADLVAIDAPFGWPTPFAAFAQKWTKAKSADRSIPEWACDSGGRLAQESWLVQEVLRFRATDRFVRLYLRQEHGSCVGCPSTWPGGFSVSTDKIALPALRTMRLLHAADVKDLTGGEVAIEAYPGPTLAAWHLSDAGYKGPRTRNRADTAAFITRKNIARWLVAQMRESALPYALAEPSLQRLENDIAHTDHVLDAFICALTAWAARVGRTIGPDLETLDRFWNEKLDMSTKKLNREPITEADIRTLLHDDTCPVEIIAAEGWIHSPSEKPAEFLTADPWADSARDLSPDSS